MLLLHQQLRYIYTGEINLVNQSGENIFRLLIASDEFLIEELFQYVQDYLIKEQSDWVQQNFVLIMNVIFDLPNYEKLQEYCITSICIDPLLTFSSNNFLSLDKDILFSLL